MPAKVRLLVDTFDLNWDKQFVGKTALKPLDEAANIVERFLQEVEGIKEHPHLTDEGKAARIINEVQTALDAIDKWHKPRLAGLDADLGVHQAALVPSTFKPDARRVDIMLSFLQRHTQEELAVFYGSASDEERLVMEAASALVGRIPTKTEAGFHWQPLLDPETVKEGISARAAVKNPQGVQKLNELMEIRSMHVTVAARATAEVQEVLGRLGKFRPNQPIVARDAEGKPLVPARPADAH